MSIEIAMQRVQRPSSFAGVNHLKLPTSSIQKSREFYTNVLPFVHQPQFDHFTPAHKIFAQMVLHEQTNLLVELRYEPDHALKQRGWDPITFGVGTRKDLEDWCAWLDQHKVKHSELLLAIKSWVLACEDPDGRIVRLYVEDEVHEWTDHPDQDAYWLGNVTADPELAVQ